MAAANKTGRFGLGFNTVYGLTDTPQLVSGDSLVVFDPHCSAVPGATPAESAPFSFRAERIVASAMIGDAITRSAMSA